MLRRSLTAAALTSALVLGATACGNDEPTPTPTTTKSPSATPTGSEWESKYTEAELADYRAALAWWSDYVRESDPIWAQGKFTPEAERIFQHYWAAPLFPTTRLKEYEAVNATVVGEQKVLWSQPRILKPGVAYVRQCVDATKTTFTIDGEVQTAPTKPFLREVHLSKSPERGWLIYGVKDPTTRWVKACSPR